MYTNVYKMEIHVCTNKQIYMRWVGVYTEVGETEKKIRRQQRGDEFENQTYLAFRGDPGTCLI